MHGGEGGHIVLKLPERPKDATKDVRKDTKDAKDAAKNGQEEEEEEEEDIDEDDENKLVIEDNVWSYSQQNGDYSTVCYLFLLRDISKKI